MYNHLFFDLDHTLWDFDRNSAESISELYDTFGLAEKGVSSADAFSRAFIAVNRQLWAEYDQNRITHAYIREHRFPMVFRALGLVPDSLCTDLNAEYLRLLPQKTHLLDWAGEVLAYLQGRYTLHIITNGFAEIQARKLASSGIAHYFTHVITNGAIDAKKPDAAIFRHALALSQATAAESLMIGDNYEADICGGRSVGMDTLFYNPNNQVVPILPTYSIGHWRELTSIL